MAFREWGPMLSGATNQCQELDVGLILDRNIMFLLAWHVATLDNPINIVQVKGYWLPSLESKYHAELIPAQNVRRLDSAAPRLDLRGGWV